MDKEPIAVDESYEIRDNQFWYNNCSFRHLIEGKNSIKINIKETDGKQIEGMNTEQIFYHSKQGIDGRITLSYTIPHEIQDEWTKYNHQIVRVELVDVK